MAVLIDGFDYRKTNLKYCRGLEEITTYSENKWYDTGLNQVEVEISEDFWRFIVTEAKALGYTVGFSGLGQQKVARVYEYTGGCFDVFERQITLQRDNLNVLVIFTFERSIDLGNRE